MAWLFLALAGLNSCIGNLLLKYSRLEAAAETPWWEKLFSPWFAAGVFFFVINLVLFARSLDQIPVSVAYPVLAASSFALLAGASSVLFGERLGNLQIAGLCLVATGIFCLAYSE